MQHAHVKRKESLMNRYVLEEYYRIPELRGRLYYAARRERARALHDAALWLWRSAKAFVTSKAHVTPRSHARPARWMARLG
jgi:hypothetical protein